MVIVLSFCTCGLYLIYLIYAVDRDLNELMHFDGNQGMMDILFTLMTCGLYSIYWYYKVGRQLEDLQYDYGIRPASISILTLVLAIFGLSIISMAITQSELNRVIDGADIY